MLIGYARVSKTDGFQALELQRVALETAAVDAVNVYHDLASGVRDDRPGLASTAASAEPCSRSFAVTPFQVAATRPRKRRRSRAG